MEEMQDIFARQRAESRNTIVPDYLARIQALDALLMITQFFGETGLFAGEFAVMSADRIVARPDLPQVRVEQADDARVAV